MRTDYKHTGIKATFEASPPLFHIARAILIPLSILRLIPNINYVIQYRRTQWECEGQGEFCRVCLTAEGSELRSKNTEHRTLLRLPKPILCIAEVFHSGSGGTNCTAGGCCFSTPSGKVHSTASHLYMKVWVVERVLTAITSQPGERTCEELFNTRCTATLPSLMISTKKTKRNVWSKAAEQTRTHTVLCTYLKLYTGPAALLCSV